MLFIKQILFRAYKGGQIYNKTDPKYFFQILLLMCSLQRNYDVIPETGQLTVRQKFILHERKLWS